MRQLSCVPVSGAEYGSNCLAGMCLQRSNGSLCNFACLGGPPGPWARRSIPPCAANAEALKFRFLAVTSPHVCNNQHSTTYKAHASVMWALTARSAAVYNHYVNRVTCQTALPARHSALIADTNATCKLASLETVYSSVTRRRHDFLHVASKHTASRNCCISISSHRCITTRGLYKCWRYIHVRAVASTI